MAINLSDTKQAAVIAMVHDFLFNCQRSWNDFSMFKKDS